MRRRRCDAVTVNGAVVAAIVGVVAAIVAVVDATAVMRPSSSYAVALGDNLTPTVRKRITAYLITVDASVSVVTACGGDAIDDGNDVGSAPLPSSSSSSSLLRGGGDTFNGVETAAWDVCVVRLCSVSMAMKVLYSL